MRTWRILYSGDREEKRHQDSDPKPCRQNSLCSTAKRRVPVGGAVPPRTTVLSAPVLLVARGRRSSLGLQSQGRRRSLRGGSTKGSRRPSLGRGLRFQKPTFPESGRGSQAAQGARAANLSCSLTSRTDSEQDGRTCRSPRSTEGTRLKSPGGARPLWPEAPEQAASVSTSLKHRPTAAVPPPPRPVPKEDRSGGCRR